MCQVLDGNDRAIDEIDRGLDGLDRDRINGHHAAPCGHGEDHCDELRLRPRTYDRHRFARRIGRRDHPRPARRLRRPPGLSPTSRQHWRRWCARPRRKPTSQRSSERDLGRPEAPTWKDDRYSCTYRSATGSFTLAVDELPDRVPPPLKIGDEAFATKDNAVIVREDRKVLIVDVTALPAAFDTPPLDRSTAAETIASTIMECWTGG